MRRRGAAPDKSAAPSQITLRLARHRRSRPCSPSPTVCSWRPVRPASSTMRILHRVAAPLQLALALTIIADRNNVAACFVLWRRARGRNEARRADRGLSEMTRRRCTQDAFARRRVLHRRTSPNVPARTGQAGMVRLHQPIPAGERITDYDDETGSETGRLRRGACHAMSERVGDTGRCAHLSVRSRPCGAGRWNRRETDRRRTETCADAARA